MQGPDPFFSNDLEGWAKVIGFFIAIVAFVGGVMTKLVSSAFSERLKTVEREIGVTVERRVTIDNRVEDHTKRIILVENDVKGLQESYERSADTLKELSVKVDRQREAQQERDERLAKTIGEFSAKIDILLKRTGE